MVRRNHRHRPWVPRGACPIPSQKQFRFAPSIRGLETLLSSGDALKWKRGSHGSSFEYLGFVRETLSSVGYNHILLEFEPASDMGRGGGGGRRGAGRGEAEVSRE